MSTVDLVKKALDKVSDELKGTGQSKGEGRLTSARQLRSLIQRRYDELPADDKKALRKRVENSILRLKNYIEKPEKPDLKNRAKGGSISKLKKGGFPDMSGDGKVTKKDILIGRGVINRKSGGLAGRLAQRGYGKARS
jgi:hypothetical protein